MKNINESPHADTNKSNVGDIDTNRLAQALTAALRFLRDDPTIQVKVAKKGAARTDASNNKPWNQNLLISA